VQSPPRTQHKRIRSEATAVDHTIKDRPVSQLEYAQVFNRNSGIATTNIRTFAVFVKMRVLAHQDPASGKQILDGHRGSLFAL